MDIKFIKKRRTAGKTGYKKKLGLRQIFTLITCSLWTMMKELAGMTTTIRPYGPIEMNPATVVLH